MPGMRKPTYKQYIFARTYLHTRDLLKSWDAAGYYKFTDRYSDFRRKRHAYRVLHSKMVQELFKLAMFEWALDVGMTSREIADRLLHIADTAELHQDQLEALRQLADLLGYRKPNIHRSSMNKDGTWTKRLAS